MVADRKKLAAGLFLASVAVYANALANRFALDDFPFILESEEIHLPLWQMLWSPYCVDGWWRPLAIFVHAINYSLAGTHPAYYHLFNILIHAAVVVLLFQLFSEMLGRPRVAFVAALLFAVHPLHTEAVTPAHSLELLPVLFLFTAWLLHWRGQKTGAAVCFLAALGFKEMAVCFVLFAPFGDWLFHRPFSRAAYGGYAAVLAIYFT